MIKVSVIIPVHNTDKYLKECLDSIINQTLKEIEIICIKDKTIKSPKILEDYAIKDNRIHIYSQENIEDYFNRSFCLDFANGEYIYFMDSNDILKPNALKISYNISIEKSLDLLLFKVSNYNENTKEYITNNSYEMSKLLNRVKGNVFSFEDIKDLIFSINNSSINKFYNKGFINNLEINYMEDKLFFLETIHNANKIYFYNEYLYIQRIPNSFKQEDIFKFYDSEEEILIKYGSINILNKEFFNIKIKDIYQRFIEIDDDSKVVFFNKMKNEFLKIKNNKYYNYSDLNKRNKIIFDTVINSDSYEYCILAIRLYDKKVKHEQLSKNNEKLKREIDNYKKLNNEILSSNSWKITRPLRDFNNNIKSFSLKNMILNKSDSYNYYKQSFEKQNIEIKKLKNSNQKLNKELNNNKNIIKNKDTLLNNKNKEIDNLNTELSKKEKEHNILKKILDSKSNNLIHINKNIKDVRIAYVLQGFPTLSETFVRNELRWLKDKGYNVRVFTCKKPQKPVDLDFDLEVIHFDKTNDLKGNLLNLLLEYNIDLVHSHFVSYTFTNIIVPVCEKLHIPYTVFAHAVDIFEYKNDKNNHISEISQSKFCKAVFTLSNYHKNYLIERKVPEDKIVITKQATDYEISEIHDDNKRNNIKNIVSISRFVEKKGIDTLIEAANLLKDKDYVFTIYGYGSLKEDLKKQINDLGLDNISIKGYLNSPEEVHEVFKKSDLLVSPCRIAKNGDRDGIPTIIFEAMAYDLPVLTTNVSAIPEVIKDHHNGFIISPDNPKLLAEKIEEISSLSYEELLNIRKIAQKEVTNISSVDKTMNTLLSVWSK